MPFPASNGQAFPLTLDQAWAAARLAAQQIQQQAIALNAQIAAGSVSSQTIVNTASFFANANALLTQYAAVPGLAAYAQQQVNNVSLDVAGTFNAMQAALVASLTWIVSNFPKDGGGNLLYAQFNGSGQVVLASFTSSQLSGLATLLTSLIATID